MSGDKSDPARSHTFVNAGCGHRDSSSVPLFFDSWQQLRVDIDRETNPDLVTRVTDRSSTADDSMDAVWSSHCLEHLVAHEGPVALREFRKVLHNDYFACMIVPDLQAIANLIASGRLDENIYESPSRPVSAHDMIGGFAPALAARKLAMTHHCCFTPAPLLKVLTTAGFGEIQLRRKSTLELVALALLNPAENAGYREQLFEELGF